VTDQKSDITKEQHKYCIERATASRVSVSVRLSIVRIILRQVKSHEGHFGVSISRVSLVSRNTNFSSNRQYFCRCFETVFNLSLFRYVAISILTLYVTYTIILQVLCIKVR